MNLATTGNIRIIGETVERSVPVIRRMLREAGLSVVEEFSLSNNPHFQLETARRPCIVLLVDTPEALLQSIALDRAPAVFLPVHVVVSGDGDTSYVYWAHPLGGSGQQAALAGEDSAGGTQCPRHSGPAGSPAGCQGGFAAIIRLSKNSALADWRLYV